MLNLITMKRSKRKSVKNSTLAATLVLLVLLVFSRSKPKRNETTISVTSSTKFEPNWPSLKRYRAPDWFRDAKFGIFVHWGVYSVPAYLSEWYPRFMYLDEKIWNADFEIERNEPSSAYTYHVKTYGHPGKFGYKDFIPLFKGENFSASEWIDIFKKSGAKYVVPVAEHHDSFAMYNSKYTRWNSVEMGPKRDVLGELFAEGRKAGIKMGASSHLAFNWAYFNHKPEFDTGNPEYDDLYGKNRERTDVMSDEWRETWWNRTKEIIDEYQPDILWFDFYLDKESFRPNHPELAAYYYNKGLDWNKEVVLQTKNFHGFVSYPAGTNVLDLERGKMAKINKNVWQTDTSIGENSWGYIRNWISKTPNRLVDDLVDIVSKNGCLLLNVGPRADGTIPKDQVNVLIEIGNWLSVNGDAVYGSRPWRVFGEGPTSVSSGHMSEDKNKQFTHEDVRFTTKNNRLYAILMDWPQSGEAIVKTLARDSESCKWKIQNLRLLGHDDDLIWKQTDSSLNIQLPSVKPCDHAFVFEVDFGENSEEATQNFIET